jgi:hypothetical protein
MMKSVLYHVTLNEKNGGRGGVCKPILACERVEQRRRTDAPCNDDKVYHIAMHKTLVVPVCAWQMVQEKSFMWENYSEGETLLRIVLLSLA